MSDGTRSDEPSLGEVHAGCLLQRLLGRGGMGTVFLAQRQADGQQVVVKFLDADMATSPVFRERFQREWNALRKIHPHPNVVRVLDVQGEGVHPCIAMEYAAGAPLDTLIEQGPLSGERAARIALDMARGLAAVHAHGLIHRDVKPANAIVGDERTKLVDFGLAKDLFLSGLTKPGEILGTARYMAPEQWEEDAVDARVDVFGLGATLYHLVCGVAPFDGDTMDEVAGNCLEGDYRRARELVPSLPPELDLVICMALMSQPAWRYPRISDMADDLERVLRGEHARVPCLVTAERSRFPLIPDEWITLGSASSCEFVLSHPSVAPEHAQLRRQANAFVLCDFQSPAGSFVSDERVLPGRPRPLRDGDQVRLGEARLTFSAPLAVAAPEATSAFLADVTRDERPAPLVECLVALDDPRVFLRCLERLSADRYAEQQIDRDLATLLGPDAARIAAGARQRLHEERSRLPAKLEALAHAGIQGDPRQWIGWWHQVRGTAPPQVTEFVPSRSLRLRVTGGLQTPADLALDDAGVVLLGRDPRCQLRFDLPRAPRLHATLLRLHQRWVVVDEGSAVGTRLNGAPVRWAFVDPGDVLTLGPVQISLEGAAPPPPSPVGPGLYAVDAASFDALAESRHPATCAGLVASLSEAGSASWIADAVKELEGPVALSQGVGERVDARAARARALLPAVFGGDAGADPVAWQRLLEQKRASLPPQVLPRGWLTSVRRAR